MPAHATMPEKRRYRFGSFRFPNKHRVKKETVETVSLANETWATLYVFTEIQFIHHGLIAFDQLTTLLYTQVRIIRILRRVQHIV